MKPSFVGIVGGIIAFISIALPWWTMTETSNLFGTTISMSVNLYLYRVNATLFDFEVGAKLWFGWTAFALMLACGILGIIGSIRRNSDILFAAATSAMSSIAIFTVGLLKELPEMPFMQESPKALFYFGTYGNSPFSFSIYLSFGFWLALTACIIMVITSARAIPLRTTMPRPPGPQLPLKYCRSARCPLASQQTCGIKLYPQPTNQRPERFRKAMTEQEFKCKMLIEKDCSIIIREF